MKKNGIIAAVVGIIAVVGIVLGITLSQKNGAGNDPVSIIKSLGSDGLASLKSEEGRTVYRMEEEDGDNYCMIVFYDGETITGMETWLEFESHDLAVAAKEELLADEEDTEESEVESIEVIDKIVRVVANEAALEGWSINLLDMVYGDSKVE